MITTIYLCIMLVFALVMLGFSIWYYFEMKRIWGWGKKKKDGNE